MLDLTSAGMHRGLVASGAEFLVLELSVNRLLVDTGLVVLHLAFPAGEVDVGVFSSWHSNSEKSVPNGMEAFGRMK